MMIREMKLQSRVDSLPIGVVVVAPEQETKAVLQFSHGICGCKERFMPVMQYMAAHGVACVAGDHRGHGRSVWSYKDLGYMYDGGYKALVDDMRMITDWVHDAFPGKPVYLLGHSTGSMAARIYVKYDDSSIDGLIVSGSPSWNPMSRVGRAIPCLLCKVGMSRHWMTNSQRGTSDKYYKAFRSEGDQAWTCSDPQVRRNFADNPLCNFTMTANCSYNVMCMMAETYNSQKWAVKHSDMPIIFISGADDPVMTSEKKFHQSVQNLCDRGYTNVTSVLYPGMRHEVLNEIGKEAVWAEILDFMGLK